MKQHLPKPSEYWGEYFSRLNESEDLKLSLTYAFKSSPTLKGALAQICIVDLVFLFLRVFARAWYVLSGRYVEDRFYQSGSDLLMINTMVQKRIAERWQIQISEESLKSQSSVIKRFTFILSTLGSILAFALDGNIRSLWGRETVVVKIFLFLNLASEKLVYNLWHWELKNYLRENKYSRVICFENGSVGLAVVNAAKGKATSCYLQHGLHDISIPPWCFDEALLWDTWDQNFLKEFAVCPEQVSFLRMRWSQVNSNEQEKVVVIALEYPTSSFSRQEMVKWWTGVANLFVKYGWRVVLRPHPRDTTNWYIAIKSADIDAVAEDLDVFLHRYGASALMTIASASALEASQMGVTVFYKEDYRNINIYCPFSQIGFGIKNLGDLDVLLSMNSQKFNSLLDLKFKRVNEFGGAFG